ncbi:MAG: serine protease [Cyclobacteriaceae bacterium]
MAKKTTAQQDFHAPVTNILSTEAEVAKTSVTEGSSGFGDEIELGPRASQETVPARIVMESHGPDITQVPDTSNLADIGVASFGSPPAMEVVIGTDERIQITDTQKYPWRVIASLLITAADNSQWIGTGWFISPRTLITAGHCVCIKHNPLPSRNGWVKKIQVLPGRNGSNLPFGGITATEFWSVKGWVENGLENYDYAAIILPAPFPQDIGFYGFGVYKDEKLKMQIVNVAGYPGDKLSGTLWYDKRTVGSLNPDKVYYAADTAGGQSGTVVYIVENGKRIGVAIHAYGGATANSGTRISSQVYANLTKWRKN